MIQVSKEDQVILHAASQGWEKPVPEHVFDESGAKRKWRFDLAFVGARVAVEFEGLKRRGKGRHQTFAGATKDIEKYNEAAIQGWLVIRASQPQVKSGAILDWLDRAMAARSGGIL